MTEQIEHLQLPIDGKLRPIFNSRDQLIHPTAKGITNFWRWFGDSRMVDDHGRPLVLFHGTGYEFDAFDASQHRTQLNQRYHGDGFHFSACPHVASAYADANRNQYINKDRIFALVAQTLPPLAAGVFRTVVNDGYDAAWAGPDEEVAAILQEGRNAGLDLNDLLDIAEWVEGTNYHKGRRPYFDAGMIFDGRVSLPGWVRESAVSLGLQAALPNPAVLPVYLKSHKLLRTRRSDLAKAAPSRGYDGVRYNGHDLVHGQPEYVVFSANQIKSAIGNDGQFNPHSPLLTERDATPAPTDPCLQNTHREHHQPEFADDMSGPGY